MEKSLTGLMVYGGARVGCAVGPAGPPEENVAVGRGAGVGTGGAWSSARVLTSKSICRLLAATQPCFPPGNVKANQSPA
jgi:hypothetical protein